MTRATMFVLVAAFIAACGGGGSSSGSADSHRTYGVVPRDAQQVVRLDLSDSAWNRSKRVLLRVPAWALVADRLPKDQRAGLFSYAAARAGVTAPLPLGDVDAEGTWRGRHAGYAEIPGAKRFVWVEVADVTAATKLVTQKVGKRHAGKSHGTALYRGRGKSRDTWWAVVGNAQIVFAADRSTLTAAIDANDSGSLERSKPWKRQFGAAPKWSMAELWLHPGSAITHVDAIAANAGISEHGVQLAGTAAIVGVDATKFPVQVQTATRYADAYLTITAPLNWLRPIDDRSAQAADLLERTFGYALPPSIDVSTAETFPLRGANRKLGLWSLSLPSGLNHSLLETADTPDRRQAIVQVELVPAFVGEALAAGLSPDKQAIAIAQTNHITDASLVAWASGANTITFRGKITLVE